MYLKNTNRLWKQTELFPILKMYMNILAYCSLGGFLLGFVILSFFVGVVVVSCHIYSSVLCF